MECHNCDKDETHAAPQTELGTNPAGVSMSTPEERIARLEARMDGQEAWLQSIDGKVDQLLAAANMGKGAWKTILWIGGLLTGVAAFLTWLADKLAPLFGRH